MGGSLSEYSLRTVISVLLLAGDRQLSAVRARLDAEGEHLDDRLREDEPPDQRGEAEPLRTMGRGKA